MTTTLEYPTAHAAPHVRNPDQKMASALTRITQGNDYIAAGETLGKLIADLGYEYAREELEQLEYLLHQSLVEPELYQNETGQEPTDLILRLAVVVEARQTEWQWRQDPSGDFCTLGYASLSTTNPFSPRGVYRIGYAETGIIELLPTEQWELSADGMVECEDPRSLHVPKPIELGLYWRDNAIGKKLYWAMALGRVVDLRRQFPMRDINVRFANVRRGIIGRFPAHVYIDGPFEKPEKAWDRLDRFNKALR